MAKRAILHRIDQRPEVGSILGEDSSWAKRHRTDHAIDVKMNSSEDLPQQGVAKLFQTAFINWLKAQENHSVSGTPMEVN